LLLLLLLLLLAAPGAITLVRVPPKTLAPAVALAAVFAVPDVLMPLLCFLLEMNVWTVCSRCTVTQATAAFRLQLPGEPYFKHCHIISSLYYCDVYRCGCYYLVFELPGCVFALMGNCANG
jgi:hypothetical protein